MKHSTLEQQRSPRVRLSERSINVRVPELLTSLLDEAAASEMTTPSGYVRRAIIAQLRADARGAHSPRRSNWMETMDDVGDRIFGS